MYLNRTRHLLIWTERSCILFDTVRLVICIWDTHLYRRHNTRNINKQSSSVLELYYTEERLFLFFMDVCVCGQTLSSGI